MMGDQQLGKKACMLLLEQNVHFGLELANWLEAHGYQTALVQSGNDAIAMCREVRPQAVFIGLSRAQPAEASKLSELLHVIQITCPRAPVIIMGDRTSGDLTRVLRMGSVRQFPIKPTSILHVGRILQSELTAKTASAKLPETQSAFQDVREMKNLSHKRTHPEPRTGKREQAICHRCQGLLYPVEPRNHLTDAHDLSHAWRCLTCGEVIDPVIMQNRLEQRSLRGVRRGTTPRQTVFKFSSPQ
jgi:RNase P subunit RPR2